jgi:hypothetical protein
MLVARNLTGNVARQQCGGVAIQSWPEPPDPKAGTKTPAPFLGNLSTNHPRHCQQYGKLRIWQGVDSAMREVGNSLGRFQGKLAVL